MKDICLLLSSRSRPNSFLVHHQETIAVVLRLELMSNDEQFVINTNAIFFVDLPNKNWITDASKLETIQKNIDQVKYIDFHTHFR